MIVQALSLLAPIRCCWLKSKQRRLSSNRYNLQVPCRNKSWLNGELGIASEDTEQKNRSKQVPQGLNPKPFNFQTPWPLISLFPDLRPDPQPAIHHFLSFKIWGSWIPVLDRGTYPTPAYCSNTPRYQGLNHYCIPLSAAHQPYHQHHRQRTAAP